MAEKISEPNPPVLADAILSLFLKSQDRDCIAGDLLEEYREMIHEGRDRGSADRWYVRQSIGFAWRATWGWATLIAACAVGRFVLDVVVPPQSFYLRALVTTYVAIALYTILGFRAVWRGRAFEDALSALLGAQIVAILMIWAATLVFLGISHDLETLTAIERSGGMAELFAGPLVITAPALIFSALGGAAALLRPRAQ
jgi:hypothetical protein